MKTIRVLLLISAFIFQTLAYADAPASAYPAWAYDPGPDLTTPMGKELADIASEIPYFPGISQSVMGTQKFRGAFGPIPWRMLLKPNSVKILFLGQDGTHIAEAAERPATAGFGGRAMDLAKYFGVSSSAGFMNAFAFTIYGQYGANDAPVLHKQADGSWAPAWDDKFKAFGDAYIDNSFWLISMDQDSPIVKWRNRLISWIIRNNPDSLKLIVTFGGAARDAVATFIQSKGGQVGTNKSDDMSTIQVPELQAISAGSNNETRYPLSSAGADVYSTLVGHPVKYSDPNDLAAAQTAFKNAFATDSGEALSQVVISHGGLQGSGVLNAAQIGGYDLRNKISVNGRNTISLNGLRISDDFVINHDVLVVQLPHPTYLTRKKQDTDAAKAKEEADAKAQNRPSKNLPTGDQVVAGLVADAVAPLTAFVNAQKGQGVQPWTIDADPGLVNSFAAGQKYQYGRSDMGPETYDFGAPASRMVNVSTASRQSVTLDNGKSFNYIVFGTRDVATFDQQALKAMYAAQPTHLPSGENMWTTRPRSADVRYVFDSGPGTYYAKLMKQNIPTALIQTHSVNRDFGHYRGTFKNPRVVILADPDGYDDLITARALTGARGQYLQGMMEDLGVGDQYLVIKTAPFSNDDPNDWAQILFETQDYRQEVLSAVLSQNHPDLILADGPAATAELTRILGSGKFVSINRQGSANNTGIVDAAPQIKQISPAFQNASLSGRIADIPRSHLSFYARIWEGTSGDHVITATDPQYKGQAFAEVAPGWATTQQFQMNDSDTRDVQKLIQKLIDNGLRKGDESVPDFLSRKGRQSFLFNPAQFPKAG